MSPSWILFGCQTGGQKFKDDVSFDMKKAKNRLMENENMAMAQLKEQMASIQGDKFNDLVEKDESNSDPQVLQVSSAVRDMLISEGFEKSTC